MTSIVPNDRHRSNDRLRSKWKALFELRYWYYIFSTLLTVVTSFTMLLDAPGPLILTSAVIGFLGTVLSPVGLYWLNYCWIIPDLPASARPGRAKWWLLAASFFAYLLLAASDLRVTFLARWAAGTTLIFCTS